MELGVDIYFPDYFAQHGFAVHAVNLRGHGNSEGQDTSDNLDETIGRRML